MPILYSELLHFAKCKFYDSDDFDDFDKCHDSYDFAKFNDFDEFDDKSGDEW